MSFRKLDSLFPRSKIKSLFWWLAPMALPWKKRLFHWWWAALAARHLRASQAQ